MVLHFLTQIYYERQVVGMKKISIVAVLIVFILTFTMILSSCAIFAGAASVASIWSKAYNTMNSLESYEAVLSMDMKLNIDDKSIQILGESTAVECDMNTEDYYFFQETSNTYIYDGFEYQSSSLEAYYYGNYFVTNKNGDGEQKIYSPMELDEYLANYKAKSNVIGFDFSSCENSDYTKNKDKTFSLKYSGFSKEALDAVLIDLGLDKNSFGYELGITDMVVTIVIDSSFLTKEVGMKFIFGDEENSEQHIDITVGYSKYNEAEPYYDKHKTDDYVLMDFKVLDEIDAMMGELNSRESGKFTVGLSESISVNEVRTGQLTESEISYENVKGSIHFDANIKQNYNETHVYYRGGALYTSIGVGQYAVTEFNDEKSSAYVKSMINSANYNRAYVTSVTETETGYTVECNAFSVFAYQKKYLDEGGTYDSATQTVTFTVKDGKISKIRSVVKTYGTKDDGANTLGWYVVAVSTFE